MAPRNPLLRLICCLVLLLALPGQQVIAAPVVPIDRATYDTQGEGMDLRGLFEYALVPQGAVDPDAAWQLPSSAFRLSQPGQALEIPAGQMMVLRVELHVDQIHDPDYLQLPAPRLDRVRMWARAEGNAWQAGEAGDRVAGSLWPFASPFPAFELPDGNNRLQVLLAIEQRGTLHVPIQWMPDHAFRANRLAHSFSFGALSGLGLALALVCALGTALFRRHEFGALCLYTLLTVLSIVSANGYAGIYLWPEWPQWNDPSKGFIGMLLVSLLLPLVALLLQLNVHRPLWWRAAWLWGFAGLSYALLQAAILPPEWRTVASLLYVIATIAFAAAVALHGVLRSDAMSAWALAAVGLIAAATALNYADLFDIVNVLPLSVANAVFRLAFVVLMLGVAVQRHRFGRDVLARRMVGEERDALTGLRSRAGMRDELKRVAALTDAQAGRNAGMILCDLRSIAKLRAEFGDEVGERLLVRLAYVLQRTLQEDEALIARIGYGRFVAVLRGAATEDRVQFASTRVLALALAQTDLPDPVREAGLRIFMKVGPLAELHLETLEGQMEKLEARSAGDTRTIRWISTKRQDTGPDSAP